MRTFDLIASILVIIGALNWGLVGLEHFDLVAAIFGLHFGQVSTLSAIVYVLVALAGLYQLVSWITIQQRRHESTPAHARR